MANSKECPGHSECGLIKVLATKYGFTKRDEGLIDCGTNPWVCPRMSPLSPRTIPIGDGPTTTREVRVVSCKDLPKVAGV